MTLSDGQYLNENFNLRGNLSTFQAENTSRTKKMLLEVITPTFRDENKLESLAFKSENNS